MGGILRRATRRGRSLPGPLRRALESGADPDWASKGEDEWQKPDDGQDTLWDVEAWEATGRTLVLDAVEGLLVLESSPEPSPQEAEQEPTPTTEGAQTARSTSSRQAEVSLNLMAQGGARLDPTMETYVEETTDEIAFHTAPRIELQDRPRDDGQAPTMMKGATPSVTQRRASAPAGLRRLTPVECERLQGWPDGWTLRP